MTKHDAPGSRYWLAQCRNCQTSRKYRNHLLKDGAARCQHCDSKQRKHGRCVGGQRDYMRSLYDNIRKRIHSDWYAHLSTPLYPAWAASFDAFARDVLAELGERPGPEYSLDRIELTLGYQPHNIQWALRDQQNQNRRNVPHYRLTPDSRNLTLWQWAVILQRLTGETKWTEAKLQSLLKHLTLRQIFNAIHPDAPAPHILEAARQRRIAEEERRQAEENFSGLVPDGLHHSGPTGADHHKADGAGEVFEDWD